MKNNDKDEEIIYENEVHEKSDDLVASKKPSKKVTDNDVVIEDEVEAPEALVKKLKEKIKNLEKEKQEYMDGWQRERADFINYKKRIEDEKVEVVKYANENLL
jgi:molecular chaperone GrpE